MYQSLALALFVNHRLPIEANAMMNSEIDEKQKISLNKKYFGHMILALFKMQYGACFKICISDFRANAVYS